MAKFNNDSKRIFDSLLKVKKLRTIQTLLVAIIAIMTTQISAQTKPESPAGSAVKQTQAPKKKMAEAIKSSDPDQGCTSRPKSEWLTMEEMALLAKYRGYKFERVKISYESCYEIYGSNKDGDLVEAYFDPSNARLARQNVVVLPKK